MPQFLLNFIRRLLGGLLLILAITAFSGGICGMTGADGIPLEWLKGTPFKDYFFPGLILFFVVGGSCLFSAVTVLRATPNYPLHALFSNLILITWIVIEIATIGYVSWKQSIIALISMLIFLLYAMIPPLPLNNRSN